MHNASNVLSTSEPDNTFLDDSLSSCWSHIPLQRIKCVTLGSNEIRRKKKKKNEGITSHPLLEMALILGLSGQVSVAGGLLGGLL